MPTVKGKLVTGIRNGLDRSVVTHLPQNPALKLFMSNIWEHRAIFSFDMKGTYHFDVNFFRFCFSHFVETARIFHRIDLKFFASLFT